MRINTLIFFFLISITASAQQLADNYEVSRSLGFKQNDFLDVNSDGILDMVTLSTDDFAYYLGNGDGTFGMKELIRDTLSNGVLQVLNFDYSDFNSDGDVDLVLAGIFGEVEIYLNNGSGFNTVQLQNVDPFMVSVFCLDMTGDGLEDVLTGHRDVSNGNQQWIQIFVNQGGGNFASGSTFVNNLTVDDIFKLKDMDNDGDEDIVKRNTNSGTAITIIKNTGTSFTSGLYYSVLGKTFTEFDFMDVDNDGFQDIVVPFFNTLTSIHWWKNLGNASNLTSFDIIVPARDNSVDITTTNLDQDNNMDVVMTTANIVYWYENTSGTFQLIDTLAIGTYNAFKHIDVVDLNEDFVPDLSVVDEYGSSVYLNDGVTQFSTGDRITQTPKQPMFVDIKDIDNDGIKDVIYSTGFGASFIKDIVWQKSDGNNFYQEEKVILRNFLDIMGYEVEDVDKDGDNDLVIGCASCYINNVTYTNRILLMWNDGVGNFSAPVNLGAIQARYIQVNDIDNDLDNDIVAVSNSVSGNYKVIIYWNNGTGFTQQIIYNGTKTKQQVFVADMNGDAKKDLVIGTTIGISTPGFEIWFNNGTNGFPTATPHVRRNFQIDVKDFDNDGDNDVMKSYTFGSSYEGIMLLKNNGAGIFTDSVDLEYIVPAISNSKYLYPFDYDDDLDMDLFTLESDSISYFENLGGGVFNSPVVIQTGNWLISDLALGNIDSDQMKEIVTASEGHNQIMSSTFASLANAPILQVSNDSVCAGSIVQINVTNYAELNQNTTWALYEGSPGNAPIQTSTTGIFSITADSTTTFYIGGYGGVNINGPAAFTSIFVYQNIWEESISACNSYTWPVNGNTFITSGDYSQNYSSSQGCDSTRILHLTINSDASGSESVVSCNSYFWPASGISYSTSGNYTTTLLTSNGCDSIVTLNLTINQQSFGDTTATACSSFNWYGTTYFSTGNYTSILPNALGCDSIITLHLTINQTSSTTETITACESYTWPLNGNNYVQSGLYNSTLINAQGCDSIVTLNLTINSPTSGTNVVTACDSYTWPLNGNTYVQSGQYSTVLSNANGCDSIVTLNLTINTSTSGTNVVTACDSYTWIDGITYTSSTTAPTWTLTNSEGCDSIVTLDLTINTTSTSTIIDSAMDIYTMNGIDYTASGNYTQTITNVNGCDSIINLLLTLSFTGLNEFANADITIYPNPSYGSLYIDWDEDLVNVLEINLFDSNGKLIDVLEKENHQYDLSTLVVGVYFIKVVTNQGICFIKWTHY